MIHSRLKKEKIEERRARRRVGEGTIGRKIGNWLCVMA
jgi:hypothetical protein